MTITFHLIGASLLLFTTPLNVEHDVVPREVKQVAAYPSFSIFESFKEGCAVTSDKAELASNLVRLGWVDSANTDNQQVVQFANMLQGTRGLMAATNGGDIAENDIFVRNVEGQDIYLFLSELFINEKRVTTCWLVDFDEENEVTVSDVTKWLDREPVETLSEPEFHSATWEPGMEPNLRKFQVYFVPKGSPVKDQILFEGVAFKSYYIGAVSE